MSATFDSTTKAAYDAATTAQARAEAIVASLTGTISVKVFDGSNTEMGSGTMADPWATAVAGAVVLGEVSSFTVGTTATPDSNWYIRFQNADVSRWARGSFGLSGADYNWSLATWEAGQTGTIGTATIVATGNAAPVFTIAPTSADIASGGGTIQFTATDPEGGSVFYSLTTTRSGITINASTGLVTVTSAAADTTGNIVVEASDGILTETATCLVTVSSTALVFDSGFEELPTAAISSSFTSENWTRVSPDGSGIAEITTAHAREGTKSYRTRIIRDGIINYRQELRAVSSTDTMTMPATVDYWIGFSAYIVSHPLTDITAWTIAQWHDQDFAAANQPPMALQVASTGWNLLQRYGTSGAEQEYSTYTDLGAITFDAWTDFVFCVRWDYRTGGNGRVRCWINEDPDNAPRLDVSRPIAYDNVSDRRWPYFKCGDYSVLWRFLSPESPNGTIHENYSDAVRIMTTGGSRGAVKPQGDRSSAT